MCLGPYPNSCTPVLRGYCERAVDCPEAGHERARKGLRHRSARTSALARHARSLALALSPLRDGSRCGASLGFD